MPTGEAGSSTGSAGAAMEESQIVRSIQFWMRAYPGRWREARGRELIDLVVDLAGPDARRLGARVAFDLVRGGWATRWRDRPPLHTYLLYRMFDRRIPVAYRSWALDDIDGFWYPMRRYEGGAWWLPIFLVPRQPGIPGAWLVWYFALVAFAAVVSMLMWPERTRTRARLKHVAPRLGELPVEGTLVAWEVPRERVTARSALTWTVLVLGITGAASVVATLLAPKVILLTNVELIKPISGPGFFWESGPGLHFEPVVAPVGGRWVLAVAILVVALGAGVLAAAVARRRLSRRLGDRPDQPHRVLRPVSRTGRANVLYWAVVVVALTWLEVSGRIALGLSVVLGVVALLLLPGAIVALVVAKGTDARDLTGSDVWWMATRGRAPRVDQPIRGLRSQPGPAQM